MRSVPYLAEFGIIAPVGRNGVEELLGVVADASDKRLPEIARACLAALGAQLRMLKAQTLEFDRMINAWHRSNETSKRLDEIGPALATALVRIGEGAARRAPFSIARTASASVSPVEILSKDTRQKRGHAKGIILVDVLPISARGSGSLGEFALH